MPRWLREDPRTIPASRRGELERVGAAARKTPDLAGLVESLFDRMVPAASEASSNRPEALAALLAANGFDRAENERIRDDLRRGRIGLAQNRLPPSTVVEDVQPDDVTDCRAGIPAGHRVRTDALVDAVWGDDPPATATKTVQKYISHLRAVLGDDVIVSRPDGYELVAEHVDSRQFERLVEQASACPDTSVAARLLEEALALWRGEPYGDLPELASGDVAALAALPPGVLGVAPDRKGEGTNALSLPLPAARGFRFQYGPGSFAAHSAEAVRLGLELQVVHSDTLGLDVDDPADLAALPTALSSPLR